MYPGTPLKAEKPCYLVEEVITQGPPLPSAGYSTCRCNKEKNKQLHGVNLLANANTENDNV